MSADASSASTPASVFAPAPALTIDAIRTTPVIVPLDRPITTASGKVDRAPLILIDLTTRQGVIGRAYLFAYFPVMLKPLLELVRALGDLVAGDEVRPQVIDTKLRARFTLLGGTRGLAGLAIAGLEMAAWDALAIAAGIPLAQCLGGAPRPIRAYNSLGMIRPADVDAGVAETIRLGFSGLKIKIGWPTLAEDLAVVRAMRRALPASCALMVDFNQSLDVVEAIRRCRALDTEDVHWIEEPVRCDDFVSAARVAEAVDTPIQIGENFAGVHDMQLAFSAAASDLVMPDVQQIGGVTGWLRAAALAEAMGTPLSSHIFLEISSHLLAVTPTCDWIEYLDLTSAIVTDPLPVRQGQITASTKPGTGLAWNEDAVKRYQAV
jgi:mandelate racemase